MHRDTKPCLRVGPAAGGHELSGKADVFCGQRASVPKGPGVQTAVLAGGPHRQEKGLHGHGHGESLPAGAEGGALGLPFRGGRGLLGGGERQGFPSHGEAGPRLRVRSKSPPRPHFSLFKKTHKCINL